MHTRGPIALTSNSLSEPQDPHYSSFEAISFMDENLEASISISGANILAEDDGLGYPTIYGISGKNGAIQKIEEQSIKVARVEETRN